MEQKEIKINCPEGFEIDKENSTFECIKFKLINKELPKTWEEFCKTHPNIKDEYLIIPDSVISVYSCTTRKEKDDRNLLPSKELAEAMLALCQLIQLRDCYNDGWKPDWTDNSDKYVVEVAEGKILTEHHINYQRILAFKTKELRNQFLENFRDLIEIAKPLL